MPVTKTAKRALRSSKRKQAVNNETKAAFNIAVRKAKKTKTAESVKKATSMADRAAKKGIIHKNKAARIKSSLSKLVKPHKSKKAKSKKTPSRKK